VENEMNQMAINIKQTKVNEAHEKMKRAETYMLDLASRVEAAAQEFALTSKIFREELEELMLEKAKP
jgi:archaellum component FlaC